MVNEFCKSPSPVVTSSLSPSARDSHTSDSFFPSFSFFFSHHEVENFFLPFFFYNLRGAILSGTMHIYAPARRREERKTNGTDWFPAVATLTRWQLRKGVAQVCHRRQETLAHPLITQLKWTGNVPPLRCPVLTVRHHRHYRRYYCTAIISALRLLHCRRNCATVYWNDVTGGRSSLFKPRAPYRYLAHTKLSDA